MPKGIPLEEWLVHDGYHEIAESILSALDTASLVKLGVTCCGLRARVQREWNVDALLLDFVGDSVAFRREMFKTRAIIGGSFALQFFLRERWEGADTIDIFVPSGITGASRLWQYLKDFEGYTEVSRTLSFLEVTRRGRTRSVYLYRMASKDTPVDYLCAVYGTHLMSFITWNKAYCLYPSWTLLEKKMYLLHPVTHAERDSVDDYLKRGFCLCAREYMPQVPVVRSVSDCETLTVKLSCDGCLAVLPEKELVDDLSYQRKMHRDQWVWNSSKVSRLFGEDTVDRWYQLFIRGITNPEDVSDIQSESDGSVAFEDFMEEDEDEWDTERDTER